MKRKLIAFSLTLALILGVSINSASAHFVEIEAKNGKVASRAEWFGLQGDGTGSVVTQRNSAGQGEVIFNDATKEQRMIVSTEPVTRAADLDWFGVTADANNLYLLAKVERYSGITQEPPIELMISIDTDHASSSNRTKLELPNTAGISVTAEAAWEYVVNTKFNKGLNGVSTSGSTTIYSNPGAAGPVTSQSCNTSTCPIQLASAAVTQGSFAEIAVPWSRIDNLQTVNKGKDFYLRFTVSTYYADRSVPPIPANQTVQAIDILDRSSGAGATETAVADGNMDEGSSFDVHFNTNGATPTYEPYSPLLITEVQPNPFGDDNPGPTNPIQNESEYIEIYNPNTFATPINLSDYKIGNAARRGSSKTMLRFKSGATLASGEVAIVAKSKQRFLAGWRQRNPGKPDPKVFDATNDMTAYTSYATGTVLTLDNQPGTGQTSFNDQVVLLDAGDGIVDIVSYGNSPDPYPGQVPISIAAVPESTSYERCPATVDTNGGFNPLSPPPTNVDFIAHESTDTQTPGVVCLGRPGVDMKIEKIGLQTAQVGQTVRFELNYSNVGVNDDPVGTVTVVDTLPEGLTFTNAPGNAEPMPTSVDGKVLTWNLPAPPKNGAEIRTIVLTATVDSGLGENTPLTNQAQISSPNELTDATTQSNNLSVWTVTTEGPPKLELQLTGLGKTPPGKQFGFQINYRNVGAAEAEDGKISLDLPAGVTLISASAPPGTSPDFSGPQEGPKKLTWSLDAPLNTNTGGTITIIAQVGANVTGSLPFSASFTSTTLNANTATAQGTLVAEFNKLFVPLIRK